MNATPADQIPLKKLSGFNFPTTFNKTLVTPKIWIILNKYANPKTLNSGIRSLRALLLTARAINANTAYGVKLITKLTTSPITRFPASIKCLNGKTAFC